MSYCVFWIGFDWDHFDLLTAAARASWNEVLEYISKKISKFTFIYILHVDDEQDFDSEYSDSLLEIQKDIQLIIDKDIAVKSAAKID